MEQAEFSIKELVLLGTMNAALILLSYIIIFVLHLIPPLWGFMDPICNFFLAPVYILMLSLVPKSYVMTIHGTLMGLCAILTGWWPGLLAGVIAGVLADLAARMAGGYAQTRNIFLSVLVFATIKALLFYLPLYGYMLFPIFSEVITQWPKEAVAGYTISFAVIVLVLNLAACMAGLLWGKKMLSRHFGRSGLVKI